MVRGFQHHTYICSACHLAAHRVVFTRHGREDDSKPVPIHDAPPKPKAGFRLDKVICDEGISGVSTKLAERPQGASTEISRPETVANFRS
jgi:hypothetical protein